MEGIDKPHTGKYKEITNDWNYNASCTHTSLLVWNLENFKRLIFVVQSVQKLYMAIYVYLHINPCPIRMQAYENKTLHMLNKTIDDNLCVCIMNSNYER
jgi:hypothetical protein